MFPEVRPATGGGRHPRLLWSLLLLLCISIANGQEPTPSPASEAPTPVEIEPTPESSAPPTLTREALEAARAQVENDANLDASVKDPLLSQYDRALEQLTQAAANVEKQQRYQDAIKTAPFETGRLKEEVRALQDAPPMPLPDATASFEEIQSTIETQQTVIDGLRAEVDELGKSAGSLSRRPVAISERLPQIQGEIDAIQARLRAPELQGENPTPGRLAEKFYLQSQLVALQSEREMLTIERRSQSEREALVQARLELAKRRLELAREHLTQLDQRLQIVVQKDADRLASLAAPSAQGNPRQQRLANELKELADQFQQVSTQSQEVENLITEIEARVNSFDQELRIVKSQLEYGQAGEDMAPILFGLARRLAREQSPHRYLAQAEQQLNDANLAALIVEEKLRDQLNLEEQLAEAPDETTRELLELRREILEKLRIQYRALIRELAKFTTLSRETLQSAKAARQFLREQLFLVRSSPFIGLETFRRLPESLRWFLASENFLQIGETVKSALVSRPLFSALWLLPALLLLLLRPLLIKGLRSCSNKIRRISRDRYGYTLLAFFYSVLLALPIPMLILYLSRALSTVDAPSDWLWTFRLLLPFLALYCFTVFLLAAICHRDGLGSHFAWNEATVRCSRRIFILYAAIYLPTVMIVGICAFGPQSAYLDSLGRIIFVLSQLWTAWLLWQLFTSRDGLFARIIREHPNRPVVKFRWAVIAIIIAMPLGLACLAAAGFVVTAFDLSLEMLEIMAIVATGSLLYWLVVRWFMIRERRLALQAALDRRQRAREQAASAAEPGGNERPRDEVISVEDAEMEEVDLPTIGHQTRHLLRSVFILGVGTYILFYLARTIPVLSTIDDWHVIFNLSLLELIQLLLVVGITTVAAINLPGLLELAILAPMKISAGTRTAISTLAQYALIGIGAFFFLAVLDIDWVQFGWIAAALSVGIGFGMQEVITNFVCGLIILFERPMRVGDIVTIEGTTGTVTRIQMRATTITNWDRQELVVPNKTFITGTLLNWSLSNAMNRLTVPVGVAYGSDTRRAVEILRQIANEHPLVLEDPAPLISFEAFGDSTLNIVLRAYLPDMDNRLGVLSDLHHTIHQRFNEAGIVIAFPQRDLNLGTGWEKVLPVK